MNCTVWFPTLDKRKNFQSDVRDCVKYRPAPHPVTHSPSSVSNIDEIVLEHKVQAEDIRSASVFHNMLPIQECSPDGKPPSRTEHKIAFRILCFFEISGEGTIRLVDAEIAVGRARTPSLVPVVLIGDEPAVGRERFQPPGLANPTSVPDPAFRSLI